jgi:hypothetical protein
MGDWIRGTASIEVAAKPDRCLAVIADVEAYPAWQSFVAEITVHERDADRRPHIVETLATTPVRSVRYVMAYEWEPPTLVSWRQASGDLDGLEGSYHLAAVGAGATQITYTLAVRASGSLGALLATPLFPTVGDWFLRQSLVELKRRCEANG